MCCPRWHRELEADSAEGPSPSIHKSPRNRAPAAVFGRDVLLVIAFRYEDEEYARPMRVWPAPVKAVYAYLRSVRSYFRCSSMMGQHRYLEPLRRVAVFQRRAAASASSLCIHHPAGLRRSHWASLWAWSLEMCARVERAVERAGEGLAGRDGNDALRVGCSAG